MMTGAGGRRRKMERLERLSMLLVAALSCVVASGENRREVDLLDQQALEYKELLKASESKEKEAVDRANTLEKQLAEVKRVNSDLTGAISDLQQQLESLQANSGPEVNRQLEEDLTVSSQHSSRPKPPKTARECLWTLTHLITKMKKKRVKRDSEPECESPDVYWDPNENKCKWCRCPAGKQIAATFCGYGILLGDSVCQDCPSSTYRPPGDNSHTCHPCSTCDDPDAVISSPCTKHNDSVCRCREGMGMIRTHCVSCSDYPDAVGCTPESDLNTTHKPSTNTTESSENSTTCRDDKQDCTSTRMYSGWEVGLMCAACFIFPIIVQFLIRIKKKRQSEKLQREAN